MCSNLMSMSGRSAHSRRQPTTMFGLGVMWCFQTLGKRMTSSVSSKHMIPDARMPSNALSTSRGFHGLMNL